MGQGIYPQRDAVARGLGIDVKNVRFINRYNGCTFGAARAGSQTFYPLIAHLAKVTGRPVKMMLPKDQELAQIQVKPENIVKFKIGATKDGHIVALQHDVYMNGGDSDASGHATTEVAKNQTELYTSTVPHWKSTWRHKDKLHSHWSIPQLHPTRIEMVLGNRHRRNGGSCRNGSCRVQTYARFETRNEAFSGQRLGRRRSGAEIRSHRRSCYLRLIRICRSSGGGGRKLPGGPTGMLYPAGRQDDSRGAWESVYPSIIPARWDTTKGKRALRNA